MLYLAVGAAVDAIDPAVFVWRAVHIVLSLTHVTIIAIMSMCMCTGVQVHVHVHGHRSCCGRHRTYAMLFSLSQAAASHRSSHRSKQSRGLERFISPAGHHSGVDPHARRPAVCLCWQPDAYLILYYIVVLFYAMATAWLADMWVGWLRNWLLRVILVHVFVHTYIDPIL